MSINPPDQPLFTRNTLAAIRELDIAVAHHSDWLHQIHAALITDRPGSPADLHGDAHHRCEFGQWYYGEGMTLHQGESDFAAIEQVHQAMHEAARRLLSHRAAATRIDLADYERFMDQTMQFRQELRAYQYSLIQQVCTVDHLTGAWNRHAMSLKLVEESERAQRSGQCCSVCMIDIDHFKRINDQYGHKVGDEALQAFASTVSIELRKYDSLFRYGGEEFLMLLPNTTLDNAAVLLNRIRETLAAATITGSGGQVIHLTASFGVAQLGGQESLEDVLEHADHALLAAKANGRNRVCVWDLPVL